MPSDRAMKEARTAPDPSRVGPKARLLTLADLDRRTNAARRAHDVIDRIHSDLGGIDRLATGERQVVQRAAMIGTMAEDIEARWLLGEAVDPNVLCTLANAQRRLLEALGMSRRPKEITPSVAEYARHINGEAYE